MDGLDWITVAEIVPVTAAIVLIGLTGMISIPATCLAAALCGAMIGFAPVNKPVARVFLGDVGSLPIGLLLAWCLLQLAFAGHLSAALLLPLYYLADATITLVRRVARRDAFWLPHRSHFYQRATDNGHTVMEVVRAVAVLNVGLAGLAVAAIYLRSTTASLCLLLAGAGLVAMQLRSFATTRPPGS